MRDIMENKWPLLYYLKCRLDKGPLLPSLQEAWKEYSILALMLGGGLGVGASAVVLVGTGAAIAGLTGGVMLGVGTTWAIHETVKS